jgi:L-ascorbate oxidase
MEFELNELIEIVFVNSAALPEYHPMHLHGYSFAVIGSETIGNKSTATVSKALVIERDKAGLLKRNLERPIIKDTVSVPNFGYTIIRFITDNPGVWMVHCHLDTHSEVAMMMLFRVGKTEDLPPKPKSWPTCGSFMPISNSDLTSSSIFISYDIKIIIHILIFQILFSSYLL